MQVRFAGILELCKLTITYLYNTESISSLIVVYNFDDMLQDRHI